MIELKQVKKERWHWTFRYEGTLYHVERLSMKKTALYTRNGSDYDDDENDIFLEDLF